MDRTGAYSPISRRMYPSHIADRNSAVLKSWLFLSTGQLYESCLHVFYRIDAAKLKWFTEKFRKTAALSIRRLKRPNYSLRGELFCDTLYVAIDRCNGQPVADVGRPARYASSRPLTPRPAAGNPESRPVSFSIRTVTVTKPGAGIVPSAAFLRRGPGRMAQGWGPPDRRSAARAPAVGSRVQRKRGCRRKALRHRRTKQGMREGQERHAAVMRHHDLARLRRAAWPAKLRRIVDRIVEAMGTEIAQPLKLSQGWHRPREVPPTAPRPRRMGDHHEVLVQVRHRPSPGAPKARYP